MSTTASAETDTSATGESGDAASTPAPTQPAILRGRMRGLRSAGGQSGDHSGGATGTSAGQATTPGAMRLALPLADPSALGNELQQMRRIAEERGYAVGRARAEAELQDAIAAVGGLAQKVESAAPAQTSRVAHAITELALAVARRVLQAEVRADPTVLCASLEAAVATINGSPEARVMLHPDAVSAVRAAWEAAHGVAFLGKRWTFEGDPAQPPGGCTLRYEHGFVEAGLEAQLEEIGIALDRAIPRLASGRSSEDAA